MNTINKTGPRTLPCTTPLTTSAYSDKPLPILTCKCKSLLGILRKVGDTEAVAVDRPQKMLLLLLASLLSTECSDSYFY